MPPGCVGLLVAAIVAATMSTHSGAINALAAVGHARHLPAAHRRSSADDPRTLRVGKLFALFWGVVLTARRAAVPQDRERRWS